MEPPKKVLWVSPETHQSIQKLKADKALPTVDSAIQYLLETTWKYEDLND